MQQNNITNLLYVGNVSLKIKVKDKIIKVDNHNKGLPALQRAFCEFITGNIITNESVPQFMDLRYKNHNETDWRNSTSILLNKLPLTGKSFEEGRYVYGDNSQENTYVAKLTAVLSSNSLVEKISGSDTRDFRLYLLSGSNGLVNGQVSGYFEMAYLPMDVEQLSLIGPGSQAIIEWSLQMLTGEVVE